MGLTSSISLINLIKMIDKNFFIANKSAVNFCESDIHLFGFGELWNVLSSFVIVGFGLYGLYFINYKLSCNDNPSIKNKKIQSNILYGLLSLIGFGSVFFHLYQSPFAHWVDIIFISMILVYSQYILTTPNAQTSNNISKINKFSSELKYIGAMCLHLLSSLFIPQIHIFLLFGTGFKIKKLIEDKIKSNYTNIVSLKNGLVDEYIWIKRYFFIALVLWIIDYFACGIITPYHTHWIFHIFIGLVSYKIIGLLMRMQ